MNFIIKNKIVIIGMALGALGGYAYYYFVGCLGGGCAITSSPLSSTIYGTIMGGLTSSTFHKK